MSPIQTLTPQAALSFFLLNGYLTENNTLCGIWSDWRIFNIELYNDFHSGPFESLRNKL